MNPNLLRTVDALLIAHLPPALRERIRRLVQSGYTARQIVAAFRVLVRRMAPPGQGNLTLAAIEAVALAEARRLGERPGPA